MSRPLDQAAPKTLILTEKPSVARDFARALGIHGKEEGYMEDARYLVTWAVGHLVELAAPEAYDPRWKSWRMDTLPILPESFQYRPIPKTRKQLDIVRRLIGARSLDRVIIATDAGREGEVIARTILMAAGFEAEERLMRFWTSQALTPEIIRQGLDALRPASEYDRLWRAGQARQIADWLVGMSCSRAATILSRKGAPPTFVARGKRQQDLFSVGRVQTAVLALIVDRKRAREAFVPEPFWLLRVGFNNDKGEWWGTWCRGDQRRMSVESEANAIRDRIAGRTGKVISVTTRKKLQPPPTLYALTDLQQEANQKYGLSAKATIQIAQELYERKKCLSYPRTDARVLGSGNVGMIRSLIETLTRSYPETFAGVEETLVQASNKRVFNDAKLTDHHALIPLAPLPGDAAAGERQVYDLVLKRFAAAFHPDHEFEQTDVATEVEGERFLTRGRRTIRPGWRQVYAGEGEKARKPEDEEEIEENLPPLAQGDPARVTDTVVLRRMTQPPPEYTEALLLKDMSHPGRYVSEEELRKIFRGEVGLGTQATRAQIIETLLSRAYLVRRKKHLLASEKGCYLIDTLRRFQTARMLASPEETARWEARLEEIARGKGSDTDFLKEIKKMVTHMIEEFKAGPKGLGRCPVCGGEVITGKRDYGCANWRKADGGCRFILPSEISGRRISPQTASLLLSTRKAGPFSGFVAAGGELFDGLLRLVQTDEGWQVRIEAGDGPTTELPSESTVIGKCPQCGGSVLENPKSFGCDNWREADGGCKFVIWKEMARKWITPQMAGELLQKGRLGPLENFISKKGKPFSATLKLTQEGERWEVRFDFGDEASDTEGPPPKSVGKCPACGGDVTEGVKAYGCVNWRDSDGGCKFVIWRAIAQKQISPAVAAELLEKGETELLSGFISRKGSPFSARLRLSTEGPPPPKVVFDFSEDSKR